MKPDDGCSARLTPGEAWAALAEDHSIQWCQRCHRFRMKQCERMHAERVAKGIALSAARYARKGGTQC